MLVNLMSTEAPKALADKDYELIIRLPVRGPEPLTDKATAEEKAAHKEATALAEKAATENVKILTSYAAAWGKGQTPKLYIHKVPNRKDMPAWHARLAVEEWDKVPKENRPGRR